MRRPRRRGKHLRQTRKNLRIKARPAALAAQIPSTERWYEIVAQLTIGGVAKMIAEHSVPSSFDETKITLMLSAQHDTLLSDAQVQNLNRGLEEVLGHAITLEIEVGEPHKRLPQQGGAAYWLSVRPRRRVPCVRTRRFSRCWLILMAHWKRCDCIERYKAADANQ